MANIFEIATYEPNKKLVLQSIKTTDTLVFYVAAVMLFLGISFTVITVSFIPIVILTAVAFVSFIASRHQMINRITFTPTKIIVDYAIGFIKWKHNYKKVTELDWFVNIEDKQVKIGRKNAIILQLALENLDVLPLLTQNVGEIMSLEVDNSETIGQWESIRLSSQKQISHAIQFTNLSIRRDRLSLRISYLGMTRFEINIKSKTLKYTRWMTTKEVELRYIKAIYYYFEDSMIVSTTATKWAYIDKRTNEKVLFFKYNRTGDQYEEVHYTQLNFKIDNRNLAKVLQDLPELNGIEIKEQRF